MWDVAFEPDKSDVVATCGGRYLCVINVESGDLMLKYAHKNKNQEFYCLSWSQLSFGNILVTGSSLGEIRFYDPNHQVSFYSWKYKKGIAINSVKFHDENPKLLFTASKDCVVNLWDIGDPEPGDYFDRAKMTNLKRFQSHRQLQDIYSLAFVKESSWILIGTAEGLFGGHIPDVPKKNSQSRENMIEFRHERNSNIYSGLSSYLF